MHMGNHASCEGSATPQTRESTSVRTSDSAKAEALHSLDTHLQGLPGTANGMFSLMHAVLEPKARATGTTCEVTLGFCSVNLR